MEPRKAAPPVKEPAPRILLVAYHFPPEASVGTHRTVRLVRHLVESGWEVTVLTGTVATYAVGSPIDQDLCGRVPDGVRVIRAPALRPFEGVSRAIKRYEAGPSSRTPAPLPSGTGSLTGRRPSTLRRTKRWLDGLLRIPDPQVGWLGPAVARGLAAGARYRPDVLYSTAPPWTGHVITRALAAGLARPWVADCRDPWARAPWREGRSRVAGRAAEVLERGVVRAADALVFTTRTNMEEYAAFYGPVVARKSHLVRNGCDPAEFADLVPFPSNGRFTLLHAGSLYGGRAPSVLFAALASLRDRGVIDAGSFCFRQMGRASAGEFDIASERVRFGLQDIVELVPPQPRRDALREMVSASCLLLLQPGTTVSIPGKLFEYFASGRPILALAEDGETSDLVRASGRGLAVLPGDQSAVEKAIELFVTGGTRVSGSQGASLFDGNLRSRELVGVIDEARRATVTTDSVEKRAKMPKDCEAGR